MNKLARFMVAKRFFLFLLLFALPFLLSSCKNEAVIPTEELISAIGEVTLDSESKIIEAEESFALLSEELQAQVENADSLTAARVKYEALLVDDLIDSISPVSESSVFRINLARAKYAESSDAVRAAVTKLADLDAAEQEYYAICDAAAQEIDALISSIGEITLDDEETIEQARTRFNSASSDVCEKVQKKAALIEAVRIIEELKEEKLQSLLAKMRISEDEVEQCKFYYSKNTPRYINHRSFALPYIGTRGSFSWLCALYDYTGEDWVFFEKIVFAVDDQRYTKTFDYYDVVRDNDSGDVWEYVDTTSVSSQDIEIFWAIANSEKTIIRFEGDNHREDFVVSENDKQAIRDVLTLYELMQE